MKIILGLFVLCIGSLLMVANLMTALYVKRNMIIGYDHDTFYVFYVAFLFVVGGTALIWQNREKL